MIRYKGTHTCDIHIQYHSCPKCKKIIESRKDYEYRLGKHQKDLVCTRCEHKWTETKDTAPSFGPFFY